MMWQHPIGLIMWHLIDYMTLIDDVALTDDVLQPIKTCHIAQSWVSELFSSYDYNRDF